MGVTESNVTAPNKEQLGARCGATRHVQHVPNTASLRRTVQDDMSEPSRTCSEPLAIFETEDAAASKWVINSRVRCACESATSTVSAHLSLQNVASYNHP